MIKREAGFFNLDQLMIIKREAGFINFDQKRGWFYQFKCSSVQGKSETEVLTIVVRHDGAAADEAQLTFV